MTLDEAIAHAREVAKELKKKAELADNTDLNYTSDYCLDCAKEHEQLASWLEELKARREADRWIPVSERLPQKWQGVLAYDNNDVFVAWRIDNAWNSSDSQFDKNTPIIAWRPLPEAYKESEGE